MRFGHVLHFEVVVKAPTIGKFGRERPMAERERVEPHHITCTAYSCSWHGSVLALRL